MRRNVHVLERDLFKGDLKNDWIKLGIQMSISLTFYFRTFKV